MCRKFEHSKPEDFEKKIAYAEGLAEEANKGLQPSELKLRLKQVVDGNKLMTWVPELRKTEYKPLMGKIMNQLQEDIVDEDLFEASEDEIKQRALNYFEQYS